MIRYLILLVLVIYLSSCNRSENKNGYIYTLDKLNEYTDKYYSEAKELRAEHGNSIPNDIQIPVAVDHFCDCISKVDPDFLISDQELSEMRRNSMKGDISLKDLEKYSIVVGLVNHCFSDLVGLYSIEKRAGRGDLMDELMKNNCNTDSFNTFKDYFREKGRKDFD